MKNNELFLKFAHQLADSIHDEINNNFRKLDNWKIKPTKNNKRPQIATKSDINSENIMRKLINKEFPNHGIIGEELGTENENAEFVWVLDPIDGTKAFVAGLPVFGTMIGLMHNNKPILGLIDQPITKDRIWGDEHGSFLNNKSIKTRKYQSIKKTICAITDPAMFLNKDESIYAIGVGLIDNQSSYEKYNTYFGVRISALMSSDESNDNIYLLAPLLGAEYYFSERFSLGGEGRLNYAFDNSKEENRIIEFSTHLFFRFYK